VLRVFACMAAILLPSFTVAGDEAQDRQALGQKLWPKDRIESAIKVVEKQRADGLLSDEAYARRKQMLEARLAGRFEPQMLSVVDPPLNFIQNGGFEQINKNSAKNRSRWLWWGGWSWGGDYENYWEDRKEYVHSGQYSARIRCTGAKGRIGISTAALPAVPGVESYKLTFWARGEGENMIFVNFEEGASGELRQKISDQWKQYTLLGKPVAGKPTYTLYFYSIGGGTIWLDDVELVPVGGKLED